MKILILSNSLAGGGTERVAATLANFWARQGWDVTVATLAPETEDFYPLDGRVQRVALSLAVPSRGVIEALWQNVRRILALRRLLRKVRPAVALAMMSTPNVLLAFASHGIADLCAIGSEHCFPPHAPLGRIWSTLTRRMYGRLAAVVALTQETAAWINTHSSAKQVPVIPNAVTWPLPDNLPVISPNAISKPGRRMLLAAGRLEAVKNVGLLIAAFARLAGRYDDWDLVVLGEGPERPALEAQVQEKKLGARVFLPGIAGNVGAWFAHADLFAMTSHSEGFPNALAEALAHGLPAISVDCDTGPRDIIRHGVDGFLVAPNDPEKFASALEQLMRDAALRGQFAVRAVDARERFSIEKIAGMWEALFGQLSASAAVTRARADTQTLNRSVP